MKDVYKFIACLLFVAPAVCDYCIYEDGSRFGQVRHCPYTCCGSGVDPCCMDSGSIIIFAVIGVVFFVLFVALVLVCCAQRSYSQRFSTPRQQRLRQRLSNLYTVPNNANNLRASDTQLQVMVPPRYSDIYPALKTSDDNSASVKENAYSTHNTLCQDPSQDLSSREQNLEMSAPGHNQNIALTNRNLDVTVLEQNKDIAIIGRYQNISVPEPNKDTAMSEQNLDIEISEHNITSQSHSSLYNRDTNNTGVSDSTSTHM